MKTGPGGAALRQIGQLFEGDSVAGLGEVQLLERFIARRDGPAFAALVARHGPMVLGVCRRWLANPLDVEDAFQATFLVLIRRAGTLRDRDRLAPWLFGVARRVATRARRDAARRRTREQPGGDDAAAPAPDEHRAELGRALVEEIDRLPGPLRLPVLLCCSEGLTYDEAASRLGTTAPAIRGRLSRARDRLRGRLTARGFAPSAGAVAALLAAETASAAVPASLMLATIRLTTGSVAGRAAMAGAVPASVVGLAEGVIRTMILTQSKLVAAAVIACGVAVSGVAVLGQDPQPPEADRLGGVEMKLDRLIKIMENANRPATVPPPATGPGMMPMAGAMMGGEAGMAGMPGGMGGAMTPGTPAKSAARDKGNRPGMPGGIVGMGMRMGGATVMPDPGMEAPSGDIRKSTNPTTTRLDAVEQRLESLEARLAEVERRLTPPASAGGADNPSIPSAVNPMSGPQPMPGRPRGLAPAPTVPLPEPRR